MEMSDIAEDHRTLGGSVLPQVGNRLGAKEQDKLRYRCAGSLKGIKGQRGGRKL